MPPFAGVYLLLAGRLFLQVSDFYPKRPMPDGVTEVAIYVATPNDLDWQLNTSLPRLLLHVGPLVVTGIFLISRDIFDTAPQPGPIVPRSK